MARFPARLSRELQIVFASAAVCGLAAGCKIVMPSLSTSGSSGLSHQPAAQGSDPAPEGTPPGGAVISPPAGRSCSQAGTAPDGRTLEAGEHGHRKFGSNTIGGPTDTITADVTQTARIVPN